MTGAALQAAILVVGAILVGWLIGDDALRGYGWGVTLFGLTWILREVRR